MYIKRSVKFLLHKRSGGDPLSTPIRMRISYAGKTADFPIGFNIPINYWDQTTQKVKSNFTNKNGIRAVDINRTIDEYRHIADEVFARYELIEKRKPTMYEVKQLFNDMSNRKPVFEDETHNFFDVFDKFVETSSRQNAWTFSTRQKFSTLRRQLSDFIPHVTLDVIDDNRMQDFVDYCRKIGYRNTTVAKKVSQFRWFLRWAAKHRYYNGTAHDTFKPKIKGVDGNSKEVIYLTPDEIKLLQGYKGNIHLEHVRDVFLFSCFTGLRYSDVAKLTRDDVKDGYIQIVTQKTSDGIKIELNKYSQSILDKYDGLTFGRGRALPVISNQKMNESLKELGRLCGIDEPQRIVYFTGNIRHEEVYPKWQLLTTHCGRRTFVVNALRLGIPAEVIIRWTGHSNYSAMKPYIKIVDELKEREMSKFDQM